MNQRSDGVKIVEYRAALGLSQMDLAMLMGVSQPQLHKLERGYASLSEDDIDELESIYSSFLAEVDAIRSGYQPSDAPWSPAARFWARRPELSVGGAVIDITS